jgi:hypothetical protein
LSFNEKVPCPFSARRQNETDENCYCSLNSNAHKPDKLIKPPKSRQAAFLLAWRPTARTERARKPELVRQFHLPVCFGRAFADSNIHELPQVDLPLSVQTTWKFPLASMKK